MIEELEIILETTSKILQKHVNHSLRQNIVSEKFENHVFRPIFVRDQGY